MDWHTDEDEYAGAKYNIVGRETERAVLNADSQKTYAFARRLIEQGGREIILFSSTKRPENVPATAGLLWLDGGVITLTQNGRSVPLLDSRDILLPGKHNIENYMTAIGLTYGYVPPEIYTEVARSFGGLEHRLELVRVKNGVSYYNSSIDSSPTRTAAALSALEGRDIVAICGGYDKQIPFEPLAQSLCNRARAVVLTGATAEKIRAAILSCPDYDPQRLIVADSDSFEDAVAKAAALGREGGCVILSPACASFDRFKNFAQRGVYFKELVREL
jgi:UDP-N-acetylmuramoylalanine--D-glutamate ligase